MGMMVLYPRCAGLDVHKATVVACLLLTAASGKVSRSAVQSFYGATLPQLGWTSAGANAWRREGELLRLDFHGRDGDLTVGFSLSPL